MTLTYGDLARHERLVLGAFKLAMRELEVPEHPSGQCPIPDCVCVLLGDAVTTRAVELITDSGIGDAELCCDCHVLLPFPLGPAYAVDSASVCEPCAQERYGDQAAEYLIA